MTKRLNYTNRFDLSTGMMYEVCVLHAQSPFVINKGITHTVHISLILYMRAQPGILIFFCWWQTELNSQQLGALGSLLLFLCLCCICMYMYFCVCVCVSCQYTVSMCVSQQVQTANTVTCLTHSAPEPLMGALYCSWLVQPLKQAPGLRQRLGPKPSLHSPHQPSCLFSEALEETLDRAYQIQTVARLCYFTHRPPLNSASFSVIVFFLAW